MSFKPAIELASHPRTESHRLARERIHALSRQAAVFQQKSDSFTARGTTLTAALTLMGVAKTCNQRSIRYNQKAQNLLAERDNLCAEYGISLATGAPVANKPEPTLSIPPALPPKPGYVIINNMPVIMTMRDQPDTLKADITADITKHLKRSQYITKLALCAETMFMTKAANWLHELADDHDLEADDLQEALHQIPNANVAHLVRSTNGR